MNTENNSTLNIINDYYERHYLGWILSKIKLSPFLRAIVLSISTYILFLISAAFSDWELVIGSFLHFWQISISFSFFFGMWFGDIALKDFKPWLNHAKEALGLNLDDFSSLKEYVLKNLIQARALLVALPFVIPGLFIASNIAKATPNELFPFPATSPAFIYVVIIEFSLLLVHLIGDIGFWFLYIFTIASKKLGLLHSLDYSLVDDVSLNYLSRVVLKLNFYLFIILASAMPPIAYMGVQFGGTSQILVTIFMMFLPTVAFALSFFGPIYFLHVIISKAKNIRIFQIREQLYVCQSTLSIYVNKISNKGIVPNPKSVEKLVEIMRYLDQHQAEIKKESTWPLNISSFLELVGSSSLPALTYFSIQIIDMFIK